MLRRLVPITIPAGRVSASVVVGAQNIYEQPLLELLQTLARELQEADSRPSRSIRPDHLSGSANAGLRFREIEGQIQFAVNLQRTRRLDGHASFADVHNFTEIGGRARRRSIQTGIRGTMHPVTHAVTVLIDAAGLPGDTGRLGPGGFHRTGLNILTQTRTRGAPLLPAVFHFAKS